MCDFCIAVSFISTALCRFDPGHPDLKKGGELMVRVNDDWVVDVDTYNYILKRDMHRMVRGKKKEDPDVPLYTIKGYFPSLSAALNHLGEEMVRERLTEGVRTLREAVQAIQECREEWRKITADILEDKT
jgi:hypothetical protein